MGVVGQGHFCKRCAGAPVGVMYVELHAGLYMETFRSKVGRGKM